MDADTRERAEERLESIGRTITRNLEDRESTDPDPTSVIGKEAERWRDLNRRLRQLTKDFEAGAVTFDLCGRIDNLGFETRDPARPVLPAEPE